VLGAVPPHCLPFFLPPRNPHRPTLELVSRMYLCVCVCTRHDSFFFTIYTIYVCVCVCVFYTYITHYYVCKRLSARCGAMVSRVGFLEFGVMKPICTLYVPRGRRTIPSSRARAPPGARTTKPPSNVINCVPQAATAKGKQCNNTFDPNKYYDTTCKTDTTRYIVPAFNDYFDYLAALSYAVPKPRNGAVENVIREYVTNRHPTDTCMVLIHLPHRLFINRTVIHLFDSY
jgi:hypothetical protein